LDNGLLTLKRVAEKRKVWLFLNTGDMEVCFLNYKFHSPFKQKIWIQNLSSLQAKQGYLLPGDYIMIEE
jgi:hypothetical protein